MRILRYFDGGFVGSIYIGFQRESLLLDPLLLVLKEATRH